MRNALEGAAFFALVIGMLLWRWKVKNPGKPFFEVRELTEEERPSLDDSYWGVRLRTVLGFSYRNKRR